MSPFPTINEINAQLLRQIADNPDAFYAIFDGWRAQLAADEATAAAWVRQLPDNMVVFMLATARTRLCEQLMAYESRPVSELN